MSSHSKIFFFFWQVNQSIEMNSSDPTPRQDESCQNQGTFLLFIWSHSLESINAFDADLSLSDQTKQCDETPSITSQPYPTSAFTPINAYRPDSCIPPKVVKQKCIETPVYPFEFDSEIAYMNPQFEKFCAILVYCSIQQLPISTVIYSGDMR